MPIPIAKKLLIPDHELQWEFTHSGGPGGQHVNTSDTKVYLSWNIARSGALSAWQRQRLLDRLETRVKDGVLTVSSSAQRSQWLNRRHAQELMAQLIAQALTPDPPKRRATKPTAGSQRRRLQSKAQRSSTKQLRRRPGID